jgi:hypothetical protein
VLEAIRLLKHSQICSWNQPVLSRCFFEQKTLPLLLSTGCFQEWIRKFQYSWKKKISKAAKFKIGIINILEILEKNKHLLPNLFKIKLEVCPQDTYVSISTAVTVAHKILGLLASINFNWCDSST